jgi:hypothetical protein
MLEIEKLKKADVISRRMYLMDHMSRDMGQDVYYIFGLLNMYNVKNRGKWFWQKATFAGALKDDFEKFNGYMDKFVNQMKSFDEGRIMDSLKEARELLDKLVINLEANLMVDRENDAMSVRAYVDDNMRGLIEQSLKRF